MTHKLGFYVLVKHLTRNKYLANLLLTSKEDETDKFGMKKKLLYILSELTDEDIEMLSSIGQGKYSSTRRNYYDRIKWVGEGTYRNMNSLEKAAYLSKELGFKAHKATLERLALVLPIREKSRKGDKPNDYIDNKTGLPKITSYEITELGELLLMTISNADTRI